MVASVYVVLTIDASNSRASTASALQCTQKPCADGPSTRATLSRRPWWQKSRLTSAPLRKSNKTKIDVERALAVCTPCGGSLSASYFDRSEWDIMYPLLSWRVSLTLLNV
jgi:hypothetical protein